MKLNYLFAILFLSFVTIVVIANVDEINLIGCTELNGMGCVCHTVERDYSVNVWVEGPESLYVGQTGIYKMFMSGGPAEAGGYNVAGRFGEMVLVDSFSFQHPLSMNELTQAFSLPFPTPQDTIYWEFGYKVLDPFIVSDTIYSCGLSLVWDTIPDFHDRWNFGPKFPVEIMEGQVPVELDNFSAYVNREKVKLKWTTSSELNNYGFDVLRSFDLENWEKIGFVIGNSTSTEKHYYEFEDFSNKNEKSFYKLKQIDLNGSFMLSEIIEVQQQSTPTSFELYQNYPNPFNPSTKIGFRISESGFVSIKIYDALGNEVLTLMNMDKSPGEYIINFDASELPSGLYFYRLTYGNSSQTKKMLLLK